MVDLVVDDFNSPSCGICIDEERDTIVEPVRRGAKLLGFSWIDLCVAWIKA